MATQPPQSLPSFAQAFGAPSLSRISEANNALPPIHSRASPFDQPPHGRSPSAHEDQLSSMRDVPHKSSRKRAHPDAPAQADDNHSSGSDERRSPKSVRIKEETEYDALPSPTTRTAPAHDEREQQQYGQPSGPGPVAPPPPPPTSRPSPSKKRRVTISGISHPINTDVRPPPADPNKSISPVVMGLPIPRDDQAAIEQVRSMLTIKQQQKELIEQRRGSAAGLVSVASPSVSVSTAPGQPHPAPDERQATSKAHIPARTGGRSPITTAPRRSVVALSANAPPNRGVSPLARQPSPPPPHHSQHVHSQQMLHPPPPPGSIQDSYPPGTHQHALPAPPISFARRRATRQLGGGVKGKPADIMISPRDAAADRLQPSIQSAPPIPRAGPGQSITGRFTSMTLPSLPPVLGAGQSTQRMTPGRVPPTPTRLSIARNPAGPSILTPTVGSISNTATAAGRSPQTASVPIATGLVPPTPAALHHPGYAGEKAAFLAPFEMFYDALADSKTLKGWLGEQLHKSQALTAQLQRQQDHLDELVAAAVERRVAPMREEVYGLHRKVEELEAALHHTVGGAGSGSGHAAAIARAQSSGQSHTYSPSMAPTSLSATTKGKAKANGIPPPPGPAPHTLSPESYQFPPPDGPGALRRPESVRRVLSPAQLERDAESSRSFPGSQTGSPVPFDVGRRLSVSAIRNEPQPPPPQSQNQHGHRPPAARELAGRALPPPPSTAPGGGAGSWGRQWSPRSGAGRASLPSAASGTSATRSSLGHPSDRPGLARRASAQRVPGEGYAYAVEGAEKEKDREKDRERERERGREASSPPPPPPPSSSSHPPRREARSPEPMEE